MTDDKIIDLRASAAAKEAARAAEEVKTAEPTGPRTDLVYEFTMNDADKTTFQADGMLMVNGSFFATGTPTPDGNSVNITFAAPIDRVDHVELISEDDLSEAAG